MIMAALDNALDNRAIQRDFARDPVSWAARTYLSLDNVPMTDDARADWEERIGRAACPARTGMRARRPAWRGLGTGGARPRARHAGLGSGARRGRLPGLPGRGEPYEPLDHGGGDVLAVPAGPYADTSGEPGRVRHYAVAAVADGASTGPLSDSIAAAPAPGTNGRPMVTIEVGATADPARLARPWQPMIGSEHLSCLLRRDRTGGRVIGTELREALRIAHDELGVRAVRAHGILDDDLGVYTEAGGRAVHDFAGIDRVYDELMEIGLRPVVELSFMPAALARDPARTVFTYGASSPRPRTGTAGRPWSATWPPT